MTRGATMLLNSFRIACRQLRSPGVTNGSYATLGSLSQLSQATPFPHSSVVDQLLKTPPLFPSPAWSPTSSSSSTPSSPRPTPLLAAPAAVVTPERSTELAWKEEKNEEVERSTLIASSVEVADVAEAGEVASDAVVDVNLPDFHAFIDELVVSVKKEIRAENSKKKRVVRRASRKREEAGMVVAPASDAEDEDKEDEDGFMICCGRRAKPIDISGRKRKLPLKTEPTATPKKPKVMDAVEMATRIRKQNRAAAKKYRQRMKERRAEMEDETEILEQEQARLLDHVQQLTVEVEEYKQKLLRMALQCPFPQEDNG